MLEGEPWQRTTYVSEHQKVCGIFFFFLVMSVTPRFSVTTQWLMSSKSLLELKIDLLTATSSCFPYLSPLFLSQHTQTSVVPNVSHALINAGQDPLHPGCLHSNMMNMSMTIAPLSLPIMSLFLSITFLRLFFIQIFTFQRLCKSLAKPPSLLT